MSQLQVTHLSLSYGKQDVLKQVSFSLKKGSIVGLLGPNGAGKSSILKILAGLVFPDEGILKYRNENLNFDKLKKYAGFHIDAPSFYPFLSAAENLRILMRMNNLSVDVQDLLNKVGLSQVGSKKVSHFSTGMKQRLAIAQTLLRSPYLLVLDEPFNGLDPNGFQDLIQLLRELNEEGITIVVSSHLLNELEQLADHFILLHHGQIALDITKEELQQSKNTIQLEFDKPINDSSNKLISDLEVKKINETSYEVKLPENQVAMLVKKLVDASCIPTRVNTLTLLQQKYLEITA
ncbi:ATP-binding cassette domain-containing protein [Urechidicola sp. KH5]